MSSVHIRTAQAQRAFAERLPLHDQQDFEDARRGFVGTIPHAEIKDETGRAVWSMRDYAFLEAEKAPDSVNPSLWRQARLNCVHGLFRVTDRIYQVRGFDIANMTIIEGDTGLIVLDTLSGVEVARAALELYRRHRPAKPVAAVIYSHSHADHFGGVRGVIDERDVLAGRVRIIAPARFLECAVSENVIAGVAMGRRAQFQFGHRLPKGADAQVDAGLGKTLSLGRLSLLAPTELISSDVETHVIDGVEIVFQLTPETEAPAEMHFYFPHERALNLAENATHTLHNLCPLRGAQVRDALAWSKYLNRALRRFGADCEVVFAQHHWPTWGGERVRAFIAEQRDLYKYLHDQTVRLMSHGLGPEEIAETLELPESLATKWHARGYYGTLSHDVKAVYQRYLSWYDGNPARLDPLPPSPAGAKYVEYMGGADAVLARARGDYAKGEFRWVAQVLNHVIFADPARRDARELAADALEQLAFLAESATWRNAYLQGARELRLGVQDPGQGTLGTGDMVRALSLEMLFDLLAVRLNGPRAQGKRQALDWHFSDTGERYATTLENGALSYLPGEHSGGAEARVTVARSVINDILLKRKTPLQAAQAGEIRVEGRPGALMELFSLLDQFEPMFPLVEPRRRA